MAGKSSKSGNWSSSPTTRYRVSGKNREYYTAENAPGLNPYATGGTIVDAGDGYVYHIFVSDGTFTVTSPPALIDSVQYMIVAGGGSAGSAGGGGGGGGFVFGSSPVSNTPGVYPIVIGAAGATTPGAATVRTGSPSTAFGLTAYGGGGGAASPGPTSGDNGGSGGGGLASPTVAGSGGLGNYPGLTIPRQGYAGGTGAAPAGAASGGGAGGFGGQPGALAIGPGRIAPEFPSTVIRQGIPAPVLPNWEPLVGPAGYAAGGYGTGSPAPLIARTNPANSGYGGNGPPGSAGGGSGIVCVRYVKSSLARATGGTIEPNTDPNHPGVWRHIFTTDGTFTVTDPTLQWIDYLAVGGGGAGGGTPPSITPPLGGSVGGGGGGGGFVSSIQTSDTTSYDPSEYYPWNSGYSIRTGEQMPVSTVSYPVVIGAGGLSPGGSGSNTTIGAPGPTQIIAYGGGGGAQSTPSTPGFYPGNPGASGGGGAKGPTAAFNYASGGSATPSGPITFSGTQGNPGASTPPTTAAAAAAGGGAGGSASPPTTGGVGWYSVISPPAYGTSGPVAGKRYFSGGGGSSPAGAGGSGGGGAGAPSSPRTGVTNTGGGGGGGSPGLPNASGAGGPGIVIIQYPE